MIGTYRKYTDKTDDWAVYIEVEPFDDCGVILNERLFISSNDGWGDTSYVGGDSFKIEILTKEDVNNLKVQIL